LPLLQFRVNGNPDDVVTFAVQKIVNAGYTGRNQAEVRKHIDELKQKGIPGPDEIPMYFPKFKERLTQAECVEALDFTGHTGEAEYVLLCAREEVYVAAGSDHTDRVLEQISIPKAKQFYPNFISREVWRLSEIRDHFDKIILRSRVEHDGRKVIFQEAPLAALISPDDLLERVKKITGDTEGLVIYSGTVAAKADLDCTPVFEAELDDPVTARKLTCGYRLEPVTAWFRGKF
jgi:hypothetical protein